MKLKSLWSDQSLILVKDDGIGGWMVGVLIDFDMGGKVHEPNGDFGNLGSKMYPTHRTWKLKNLDWRQLAVMIVHLVEPRITRADYNTKEPNFC